MFSSGRWRCMTWNDECSLFNCSVKILFYRVIRLFSYCNIWVDQDIWIENFLVDRPQREVVNGKLSTWAGILSGIPQGNVLGQILMLFLLMTYLIRSHVLHWYLQKTPSSSRVYDDLNRFLWTGPRNGRLDWTGSEITYACMCPKRWTNYREYLDLWEQHSPALTRRHSPGFSPLWYALIWKIEMWSGVQGSDVTSWQSKKSRGEPKSWYQTWEVCHIERWVRSTETAI